MHAFLDRYYRYFWFFYILPEYSVVLSRFTLDFKKLYSGFSVFYPIIIIPELKLQLLDSMEGSSCDVCYLKF